MKQQFSLLCAVHLFLVKGNKILLLRRFNTGYEDGNFSLIAGHINGGETIQAAMIREAREEAGISIDPANLEIVLAMHRRVSDGHERIDYFLRCENWQGDVKNLEPHKCDLLEWFDIHNLPRNIIPYVAKAIGSYLKGINFDSFGF